MKTIKRISKKVEELCCLSNVDINQVRANLNRNSFLIKKCETKAEMDYEGVDYNYPYVFINKNF